MSWRNFHFWTSCERLCSGEVLTENHILWYCLDITVKIKYHLGRLHNSFYNKTSQVCFIHFIYFVNMSAHISNWVCLLKNEGPVLFRMNHENTKKNNEMEESKSCRGRGDEDAKAKEKRGKQMWLNEWLQITGWYKTKLIFDIYIFFFFKLMFAQLHAAQSPD